MDIDPIDELELEERPDEDNDPFADTLPDIPEETEASFGYLPAVPDLGSDIRSTDKQEAINKFYESITDLGLEVDRNAPIESKAVFYRS